MFFLLSNGTIIDENNYNNAIKNNFKFNIMEKTITYDWYVGEKVQKVKFTFEKCSEWVCDFIEGNDLVQMNEKLVGVIEVDDELLVYQNMNVKELVNDKIEKIWKLDSIGDYVLSYVRVGYGREEKKDL